MPIETVVLFSVAGALGVAAIALLSAAFFTVEQRTTVIVQRLGKFLREVPRNGKLNIIFRQEP